MVFLISAVVQYEKTFSLDWCRLYSSMTLRISPYSIPVAIFMVLFDESIYTTQIIHWSFMRVFLAGSNCFNLYVGINWIVCRFCVWRWIILPLLLYLCLKSYSVVYITIGKCTKVNLHTESLITGNCSVTPKPTAVVDKKRSSLIGILQ